MNVSPQVCRVALIQCPECGKEVSSAAAACPSCGHPVVAGQGPPNAPRQPLRWLVALALLVTVAAIGYMIYWQLTFPERLEARLHQLNCELAQRIALGEPDPQKANLLAATARVVCSR